MGVGHRDLKVWQRAMDLAELVYQQTGAFPPAEAYGLTAQMRRAAVSIPSNLAEGHGRGGKEYGRYADIAYGSLLELETQAELAIRLGYISPDSAVPLLAAISEVGRMLNGLRGAIRRGQTARHNHPDP